MFGWGKKKQQPASSEDVDIAGGPLMAVVLMAGTTFPFAGMQKVLAATPIAGLPVTDIKLNEKQILSFDVGDDFAAMTLMPAKYPADDLNGPIQTSWMWPKGTSAESVNAHQTFLLIALTMGKSSPVERLLKLTAITAMAARAKEALGIYWPQATMVHSPKLFIDMAKEISSPEAPPVLLWIDYRLWRNPDGTSGLHTTGLKKLGHMEIEIPSIDMPPGELREWCVNITYYLLEKGPVLLDGQTIGVSADHQVRISYRPSQFGKNQTVIRLVP